jgi:2-aminoethylphosphonate-pyruvate transaminase
MPSRAVILAHHFVLRGGAEFSPASIAVIRQTLESLTAIGIRDICVVDGERAHELAMRLQLHTLEPRGEVDVEVRSNPTWRQASGAALLSVRDFVERGGECLVVPADRPLAGSTLRSLCEIKLGKAVAAIAVLPATIEPVELGDVSRVQVAGRKPRVRAIGCDLAGYDALFAGHALITPAVLDDLEPFNNPELADGLGVLLGRAAIRAVMTSEPWPWDASRPAEPEVIAQQVDAILESKAHPRYTLLNPGPVNTTARVKSALIHHDVCHRDANFTELMVSLSGKLRRIFRGGPQHTICLITGSGTAAMECAISSAVPRGGKILVVDNGAFGERALEIAQLHEMDVVHLRYPWGDQVDPADVRRALELDPSIDVVAMPHHETSVGLLNPVREIGALCREHDALLIVDAVSSLGAEDLDVVRDNIDICFSSANKCLHAISGAGFLCVAPRAWQKIEHVKPRSYYLDLKRYRRYADELAHTPFTPAVSTYFALEAACDEFLADGHSARWAMYRGRNRKLRDGLANLGMAPFTRTGRESHSVVTACVPEGIEFRDLYAGLKQRGYIVYGCKEVLADRFFQVANMGELSPEDIDAFLGATAEVIAELRRPAARRASA